MTKVIRQKSQSKFRKLLGLSDQDKLPLLALLANAEDERTGDASEVYAFQKPAGRFGTEQVARDKAFDPNALARAIVIKNGLLPRSPEEARKLVQAASGQEPREYWLYAKSDGWQRGLKAFAHRGRIFGNPMSSKLKLKVPISDRTRSFPLSRKGTFTEWQRVTKLAEHSSRLQLALCAAFAAPLLKVIELQSFSIVLAGRSKAGKSTALLAAGSVIGIGTEGALPNFNSTTSALQEAALEFVDRVMPANEIALVSGSRRDAYSSLRPLTYRYAEGRDTARHSKSVYANDGAPLQWRGIMLISSENSFDALAELAGEKRDEGEYARAFDVPAVRNGNTTIFDGYPKGMPQQGKEKWAREQLVAVRQICADHHGQAFDRYIKFLVENRVDLRAKVERPVKTFLDELKSRKLSGALQHAARNFAVIYAGGVLAHEAGLTPSWKDSKTLAAIEACFLDGLQEAERMQTVEERAKQIVTQHLGSIRPLNPNVDLDDVQSWSRKTETGVLVCVRTPEFQQWFSDAAEERAAIKWLIRSKLLILKDGAKPNYPNLEWAVTWPKVRGKGFRCYQFKDPRTSH